MEFGRVLGLRFGRKPLRAEDVIRPLNERGLHGRTFPFDDVLVSYPNEQGHSGAIGHLGYRFQQELSEARCARLFPRP